MHSASADQERGHHEGSGHSHRGDSHSGSGSMAALTGWVLEPQATRPRSLAGDLDRRHRRDRAGGQLSLAAVQHSRTRGLRDEQGARRDLRRRRRRRTDRARRDAPTGEDGRFARRPRRARCGGGEGRGGAAGVDERLLRLDRRPGVRLRRRPHHLRARLHHGQGWSRPRAGGGSRGASRVGGCHRRRLCGRGDRARRAARLRRGERGKRDRRSCWGRCWRRWARSSSSPSSSVRSWPLCRC